MLVQRRKIRVSYKDIRANFRDVSDAQGSITLDDLFAILSRYDIDMTSDQAGKCCVQVELCFWFFSQIDVEMLTLMLMAPRHRFEI